MPCVSCLETRVVNAQKPLLNILVVSVDMKLIKHINNFYWLCIREVSIVDTLLI